MRSGYDLSSGKATDLAQIGEGATANGLDSLALDSSGFAAWRETSSPHPQGLRAISCPSASPCVAGDDAGNILTSSDPAGGPDAWSIAGADQGQPIVDQGQQIKVSCPSVSMCVAADFGGNILVSTDPTGGQSAWSEIKIDQGGFLSGVSCASITLCVAAGGGTASGSRAMIFTSSDPGGGASAWSKANLSELGIFLIAVSCPSVSLCVAVGYGDGTDDILTSTDPTGGKRARTRALADPASALRAVSCPSVSMCVAGDGSGDILTSTDPTGGASAWSNATVDIPGCPPLLTPCTSERLYAHDDHGTRVVDTAPQGDGNSIDNVALNGDSRVLSWTNAGTQRQLQLR